KTYLADPISIIEIWNGGLAIHGALAGGAAFIIWYCRKHHLDFLHVAGIIFPYILLAQAIGRWGNFVNQEAYGQTVDESYYDGILSFLKSGMYIGYQYREPMFFYESVANLLGLVLILLYEKHSVKKVRGQGVFCYLSWYGLVRFWIETRRTDALMIGNLKMAQVTSIVFVAVGLAGLLGAFNKRYLEKKPLIIFDFDGTLLDTAESIYRSFEHVFAKYAPDLKLTDEDRAGFLGPTLEETFRKYIPDGDIEEMVRQYREFNREHHTEMVRPFAGVMETMAYLKENGYEMAIASSKMSETIKLGMSTCSMEQYFDDRHITGIEEIKKVKPDKETIARAYQKLGRNQTCTIYVGDSVGDIQCGINAGVFTVGVLTNSLKKEEMLSSGANRVIENLEQLKDILKEKHLWTTDLM
ncbi:MAG: prolipoprotein diacylglyceryl transferase, partial [Erysipelotrichaceae bacterium]|nr:prolipoprotein diacylglyceryl transferase [Erysipelotrichaceae bacterium]